MASRHAALVYKMIMKWRNLWFERRSTAFFQTPNTQRCGCGRLQAHRFSDNEAKWATNNRIDIFRMFAVSICYYILLHISGRAKLKTTPCTVWYILMNVWMAQLSVFIPCAAALGGRDEPNRANRWIIHVHFWFADRARADLLRLTERTIHHLQVWPPVHYHHCMTTQHSPQPTPSDISNNTFTCFNSSSSLCSEINFNEFWTEDNSEDYRRRNHLHEWILVFHVRTHNGAHIPLTRNNLLFHQRKQEEEKKTSILTEEQNVSSSRNIVFVE